MNKSMNICRAVLAISLIALIPQIPVQAMDASRTMASCPMMHDCEMTLDMLPTCIKHHWEDGDILNGGVYTSLSVKAYAAIAARDGSHVGTAINMLTAFINQVNALRSVQIEDVAADCLVMHAMAAIDSLKAQ